MRIVKVVFEKLFGYLNYTIPFYDMVTIFYGLNGSGKTTMLKIINAVFNGEISEILEIEFQSVEFFLSNGDSFKIIRHRECASNESGEKINYAFFSVKWEKDGKIEEYNPADEFRSFYVKMMNYLERSIRPLPYLRKTNDDEWLDLHTDTTLTIPEVIEKYGNRAARQIDIDFPALHVPEEVQDMIRQTAVYFIKTDRLTYERVQESKYSRAEHETERRVKQTAEQLSQKIKEAIQSYAKVSQEKDRTFPLRVIQDDSQMTVQEIRNKIKNELEEKRKELAENGLLEEDKNYIDFSQLVIDEKNSHNLALYVKDTEEKLATLDSLSKDIDLFRSLIEQSFDQSKRIHFNKDNGFFFESKIFHTVIPLEKLSSGEQHQIVMLYDFIFNTGKDTLVLIDEPELSLHISWQMEYLDELMEIIERKHFYAVLATHSPQIVNGKWDIAVSLSESNRTEGEPADMKAEEEDLWELGEEDNDGT